MISFHIPHRTPPMKIERNEAYGRVTVGVSTSHYETVHHEETMKEHPF